MIKSDPCSEFPLVCSFFFFLSYFIFSDFFYFLFFFFSLGLKGEDAYTSSLIRGARMVDLQFILRKKDTPASLSVAPPPPLCHPIVSQFVHRLVDIGSLLFAVAFVGKGMVDDLILFRTRNTWNLQDQC